MEDYKQLDVSISGSVVTADPQMVTDSGSAMVVDGYAGKLYRYNSEGEIVPDLAKSYEVSEDGLIWTFYLEEDAKWSNGDPVKADDFVFAIQRIADPETGSASIYFLTTYCKILNVEAIFNGEADVSEIGVYALDDHTVSFFLDEPCPYFESLVTTAIFAPCNRSFFYSCNGHYCETSDYMISSGPFVIDRYEPLATQIHYSKNQYYVHSEEVDLDAVCLYSVPNQQQGYMCFDIGQIDVVSVGGELLDMIGDDSHIRHLHGGSVYLNFNFRSDAINNLNIRRALTRSIDRQSLVDNVVRSGSVPMYRFVDRGFYYGESDEQYDEQTEEFADLCSYDPDAALELWNQGLEELGTDSVDITLAYRNVQGNIVEVLVDQWQRTLPGLHITLKALTTEQWVVDVNGGDHDIILAGWVPDYADPTAYLSCFATNINSDYPIFSDPVYDDLLNSSRDSSVINDVEARNEILHEAELYLAQQGAYIPLLFNGVTVLVSDRTENFSSVPAGGSYIFQDMRLEE